MQSLHRFGYVATAALILLTAPSQVAAEEPISPVNGSQLIAAARDGDYNRVRQLITAGVDVDSPGRNGMTALMFAVNDGQIEEVRWLLEQGARADLEETFFHSTSLERALNADHHDIALLLLQQRQPGRVERALMSDQPEIVAAAIASASPLWPWDRDLGITFAQQRGDQKSIELLQAAEVRSQIPNLKLDDQELRRLAGKYRAEDGSGLDVELVADGLVVTVGEKRLTDLTAVADRHLRSRSKPEVGVVFGGRSTMIEFVRFAEGPSLTFFRKADAEERKIVTSEPPAKPRVDAPSAPRSPAIAWPSFRGPRGSGVGDGQGVVTSWDVESGSNIRWRIPVPGLAHASPVVWQDRVFIATAVSQQGDDSLRPGYYGDPSSVDDDSVHDWQVLAYSSRDGSLLWQRSMGAAKPGAKRHLKATQANSTPVTDGEHLVVLFPTTGLTCLSLDGEVEWQVDLGHLPSGTYDGNFEWGFASSPVLYQDMVIVQADVHGGAYLAAWDLKTGEQRWRVERDEIPTWSTPALYTGGKQHELITNGTTIRGYDPATGRELWTLGPNSETIVATPVVGDDLFYVTGGYPPVRAIYAIRPGSRGDLTLPADSRSSEAIAWSHERGGAYVPTPLLYRGILYMGHNSGRIAAYDASNGERIYRARLSGGGTLTGSPVAADGKLFFPAEDGDVHVVTAGREYRELAVNPMGEILMTSPAISDGVLYLRSQHHLVAVSAPTADLRRLAPHDLPSRP